MILTENRGFLSRNIWDFFAIFCRAIALGSKPPLVTRIARTGLGTRLILVQPKVTKIRSPKILNLVQLFLCPVKHQIT